MRELIQPTLKIVAKTGLFLAVVAWVVGQHCYCIGISAGGNFLDATSTLEGVVLSGNSSGPFFYPEFVFVPLPIHNSMRTSLTPNAGRQMRNLRG